MTERDSVIDALRREIERNTAFIEDTLLHLVGISSIAPFERAVQGAIVGVASACGLDAAFSSTHDDSVTTNARYFDSGFAMVDRPNVVISVQGKERGPIVLNSHCDTVQLADGWTRDSRGEYVDGRVYGLGSCDAKGGLVAALAALRAFVVLGIRPSHDLMLQSVVDEEGSGNGTLAAILNATPPNCRFAVVLEPTGLRVATGHRGMLVYRAVVRGRSGHGALGGGANAIMGAARVVQALNNLKPETRTSRSPRYPSPNINVGKILGGKEVFTTPDLCEVSFSVRYAQSEREHVLAAVESEFDDGKDWGDDIFVDLERDAEFDAAETDAGDPLVVAFRDCAIWANGEAAMTALAGTCDARHFAAVLGVPTVIYGPGELSRAHSPDEYVEIEDILKAATTLASFCLDGGRVQ